MKWSRLPAAGILFLSVTLVGVAGTDTAKKIVGIWELVKGEGAPPGSKVEFTKDGKLKLLVKAEGKELKLEGSYKVKDDKITVTLTVEGKDIMEVNTVKKLNEKELILADEKGKEAEFKRINPKK